MSAPVLPKGHEEFAALAVAWAIDALEPADQERFEAHQAGCDDCERTVRDALEVAVELAYGVPDIAPPPSLRLRVLSAAIPESPAPGGSSESLRHPAGWNADRPADGADRRTDRTDRPSDGADRPSDGLDRPTDRVHRPSHPLNRPTDRVVRPSRPLDRPGDGTPADDGSGDDDPAAGYGRHAAAPRGRTADAGDDGGTQFGAGDTRADVDRGPVAGPGGRPVGTGGGHLIDRGGRHGPRAGTVPGARRSRRRLVSVFAAAALVGLSAVTTWQVTRPAPVSAPIASADRVAALTSTDGNRALATVVVRDGRVDVVTDGLPTTTGTTAYYVWGVPAGDAGVPQVLGTFEVTQDGLHSYPVQLTRAIGDYPVLAVSQEPAGSTPTTPGDVLARGALG